MTLQVPNKLSAQDTVINEAVAANGAPTGSTKGLKTRNHKNLHLLVQVAGGTTTDIRLWARVPQSDVWGIFQRFGTNGTQTFTTAAGNQYVIVEIDGTEEIYLEIVSTDATVTVFANANSTD